MLQKHRIKAMIRSIEILEENLSRQSKFCFEMGKVYHIKDRVLKKSISDLNKYRRAAGPGMEEKSRIQVNDHLDPGRDPGSRDRVAVKKDFLRYSKNP